MFKDIYFRVVDLRALIIRGVYLMVLAGLLGYVGTQDQRTLREMWQLAAWPQTVRDDAESVARDLLEYAAPLLGAPRAVLTWVEVDAPWRRLVTWDRGVWTHEREPAEPAIVDIRLRDRAFIRCRALDRPTLVLESGGPQLTSWEGAALDPAFARRLAPGAVLSVPVRGESFAGRLFVTDKREATLDDLVLAEVVAGIVRLSRL
jgi:hypothetical protein